MRNFHKESLQKNRKFLLFRRDLLLLMFETSLLGFDGREVRNDKTEKKWLLKEHEERY